MLLDSGPAASRRPGMTARAFQPLIGEGPVGGSIGGNRPEIAALVWLGPICYIAGASTPVSGVSPMRSWRNW